MGARGRKSAAELSVLPGGARRRPDPPRELTPEQAAEWRAIVGAMKPDHFPRQTHGALVQLCRHRVRARRLAQMIERMEADARGRGEEAEFDLKTYRDLLRSEEEQSRAIASLSTKLRVTQQTLQDRRKPASAPPGPKPWEEEEAGG